MALNSGTLRGHGGGVVLEVQGAPGVALQVGRFEQRKDELGVSGGAG